MSSLKLILLIVVIPLSIWIITGLYFPGSYGLVYGTYLFILAIYLLRNQNKFKNHFSFYYLKNFSVIFIFSIILFVLFSIFLIIFFSIDNLFGGSLVEFVRPFVR